MTLFTLYVSIGSERRVRSDRIHTRPQTLRGAMIDIDSSHVVCAVVGSPQREGMLYGLPEAIVTMPCHSTAHSTVQSMYCQRVIWNSARAASELVN